MTTSRHFSSPIGAAGPTTTRRFSHAKRLGKRHYLSATERPGGHLRPTIRPMPDAMTKWRSGMGRPMASGSPGRPSMHRCPAVLSWLSCSRQSPQGLQDLAHVVVVHDRRYFIDDIYYRSTPTPVTNHRPALR